MNRYRMIALGVLAVAMLATWLIGSGCRSGASGPRVTIHGHDIHVEVARDFDAHALGLSGRQGLPVDTGMLFVFSSARTQVFHMLNCYFPMDIAFIAADGTIINTDTMAVECDPANPAHQYRSAGPAQYVLETVAGSLGRIGASPGDKVMFVDVFEDR